MSVRLVSVYQKASFVLLETLILLKEEIIFHHGEMKIAYLFLKSVFCWFRTRKE